ncbi:hypothetical protein [Chromobacterium piscinae]|uniref:hypothetical protein n=1 Tax=Chromobacterium piscinae TaxID=686831 RepID=UPI001C8C44A1|nr:hypothetical protein [Chromobacterium piscinae]MBX9299236.1 hypothetical protein [Chromobacterium vaccinii]MBX9358414.1 hypothetical protein [Chromobacterium vaccinii]MCD4502504.1 hypothetical protein [Chromobacterium piscinae]MCD5327807.1 hypothetical protein [Chromobacterium piscinae]
MPRFICTFDQLLKSLQKKTALNQLSINELRDDLGVPIQTEEQQIFTHLFFCTGPICKNMTIAEEHAPRDGEDRRSRGMAKARLTGPFQ